MSKTFWPHGLQHDTFHFVADSELNYIWETVAEPFQVLMLLEFLATKPPHIVQHHFVAV
jgi:hypothetical protein